MKRQTNGRKKTKFENKMERAMLKQKNERNRFSRTEGKFAASRTHTIYILHIASITAQIRRRQPKNEKNFFFVSLWLGFRLLLLLHLHSSHRVALQCQHVDNIAWMFEWSGATREKRNWNKITDRTSRRWCVYLDYFISWHRPFPSH